MQWQVLQTLKNHHKNIILTIGGTAFAIHSQGLSVSGIGSFGLELTTKKKVAGIGRLSTYFEGGYTDGSKLNFSYDAGVKGAEELELGHVDLGGGYFRWGIGMRF